MTHPMNSAAAICGLGVTAMGRVYRDAEDLAAEAVYSFLGLGVQPPASTWGILLSNATRYVTVMPSFFLIAAGSLVLVVLAFNLVGDALRDALDPKAER